MIIRVAGFGGQGIMRFGQLLGQAAVMEGKYAMQTQSYGSASRGGAAQSDICISQDEPYQLNMEVTDVLVAMSQPGLEKFLPHLKSDGLLIYDPALVEVPDEACWESVIPVKALEMVNERFGNDRPANLLMLGLTVAVTQAVGLEAVKTVVVEAFGAQHQDNMRAIELGYEMGLKSKEVCT